MGVSQWSDGWVQGKSMGKWRLGLPPLMETPVSLQYGVEDTHAEAAEAILTSWSLRYHLLNRPPPKFAPILLSSLGFWNGIWKNQTSLGWIQSCAGQFPFWRVHKFLIVNIIIPYNSISNVDAQNSKQSVQNLSAFSPSHGDIGDWTPWNNIRWNHHPSAGVEPKEK